MRSISVVLPLALPTTYSYSLPPALEERVCIGSRVVVQFGAKRYYTAIVSAVYAEAPRGKEQEKKLNPLPMWPMWSLSSCPISYAFGNGWHNITCARWVR